MDLKDESLSQILDYAIQMETDGIEFYQKASEKTSHPFGKKMFLALADDEAFHLEVLKNVAREYKIPDVTTFKKDTPYEKVKTLFDELRDVMKERVSVSSDDLQALEVAIKMEQKGYEAYKREAESASDQEGKTLFEYLVREEIEHLRILQNTYHYLENSKEWFLWEERGLLDGGG